MTGLFAFNYVHNALVYVNNINGTRLREIGAGRRWTTVFRNKTAGDKSISQYNMAGKSILVICQEPFKKDFDMDFLKKGNLNRPSIQRD